MTKRRLKAAGANELGTNSGGDAKQGASGKAAGRRQSAEKQPQAIELLAASKDRVTQPQTLRLTREAEVGQPSSSRRLQNYPGEMTHHIVDFCFVENFIIFRLSNSCRCNKGMVTYYM